MVMMSPMDITIGFASNSRELTIENLVAGEGQDADIADIKAKLANGEGVLELSDAAGHNYLIQANQVAYVRTGSTGGRRVGFIA